MILGNTLVAVLVGIAATAQVDPVAPNGAATPTSPYPVTVLRQLPRSDKEVDERLDLAAKRMADLQAMIAEPLPEPADEATVALRSLRETVRGAWETYAARLDRFKQLKASLAMVTSAEFIASATDRVARTKREAEALENLPTPIHVLPDDIAELEAQLAALQAEVNTLSEAQTRRSQILATGFQQQQEQFDADRRRLRGEGDELLKQADAATDGTSAQQRRWLEQERIDVQAASIDLALEMLPAQRQEAELLSKQDERLLEASRKKMDVVTRRLASLREMQSRSRLETLEYQRTRASDPVEISMLDLRLLCERALVYYFQRPERSSALQHRFPMRAFERITERMSLAKAYWDRTTGSLEYFSGKDVVELEQQLDQEHAEIASSLAGLRERLAQTMEESQDLQSVRESVRKRFTAIADQLTRALATFDMETRAHRDSEITNLRVALEESMRTAIKSWEDVAARLNDAVASLEEHHRYLQTVGRQLRFKRITNRDSGLIGADWAGARAELVALFQTEEAKPQVHAEKQARHAFHEELFGARPDSGAELRGLLRMGWTHVRHASRMDWVWIVVAFVVSVVAGGALYRVTRSKGHKLARDIVDRFPTAREDSATGGSGLSMRVNLMILNMIGDLAIPLLVALAIVLGASRVLPQGALLEGILVLMASVGIAITGLRLVHHLFEAYSAPHRPIPCSDDVARHYRLWLSLLILLSLVALPMPMLLHVAGIAPALQAACMETYKAGLLVLLFLFLFRKKRVLGVGDMTHRHWWMMVVWIVYPVVIVCVAALLLMQLLGYGAFVTSVGAGLLLAIGIVFAVGAATEYLADLIDEKTGAVAETPVDRLPEIGTESENVDTRRVAYSAKLLKAVVRLVGLGAAAWLVVWAWDVPVRPEWLAWRKLAFGALVVVVALVVDRIITAALHTLYRSGRLPISTVNILRRWARGALTVLVVLVIIALAGFKMDSLWTFLTAILAMVAIGFVAVWSILSNILTTLVILIWRPFNVGECVEVLPEGVEGQVIDINFLYTTLKTEDGKKVAIPNNFFAQKFIRRSVVRGAPKRTLAEQLVSDKPLDGSST